MSEITIPVNTMFFRVLTESQKTYTSVMPHLPSSVLIVLVL